MARYASVPFAALLALGVLTAPTSALANLIVNPGNEDPLVGGEISGWTEVIGSNWTQRSSNPAPFEGNNYFFAGVGALGELAQSIDVSAYSASIDSGLQNFFFEGYVRSFNQSPTDTTQIIVEFLDISSVALDSFDSGPFSNTSSWHLVADSRFAPALTRSISIRLISDRNSGSNNDGYFDALSLTTSTVPLPSPIALFAVGLIALGFGRARTAKPQC
ncbi:MAG: hypothetical protein K9L32_07805 [Chromatiaceae bacterium]|nr:hypothetical protein [Chromatiaceae bacterium]MCF8004097.1 hypothetical protein [Chromatiaceae bacterium]